MNRPSAAYLECLEASKLHHAESKTFSGKFLRPHAPFIEEIIRRNEIRSVLDYGCGKGNQYTWINHETIDHGGLYRPFPKGFTIEQYWGLEVAKFDPAYPPFAAPPRGQFGLVLCTHTLGAIPVQDYPWVVRGLFEHSVSALYIAEKIGAVKKRIYKPGTTPIGWDHQRWKAMIEDFRPAGSTVETWLATRSRTPQGAIVQRERLF